ncbi:hypothetical protein K440DRAFT_69982 [Wilcoxina mikolae CBS 423.85]|nr:hypothetical protein K440DRAFT_69982 [Wilcoxina mikolae CBS 423.85]
MGCLPSSLRLLSSSSSSSSSSSASTSTSPPPTREEMVIVRPPRSPFIHLTYTNIYPQELANKMLPKPGGFTEESGYRISGWVAAVLGGGKNGCGVHGGGGS